MTVIKTTNYLIGLIQVFLCLLIICEIFDWSPAVGNPAVWTEDGVVSNQSSGEVCNVWRSPGSAHGEPNTITTASTVQRRWVRTSSRVLRSSDWAQGPNPHGAMTLRTEPRLHRSSVTQPDPVRDLEMAAPWFPTNQSSEDLRGGKNGRIFPNPGVHSWWHHTPEDWRP